MEWLNIFIIMAVTLVGNSKGHPTIPPHELDTLKADCYYVPPHQDNPIGSESTRTENGYYFHYYRENPDSLVDNEDRYEETMILNPGTDNEELVITGKYSYQNHFIRHYVMYKVDKNGYRAQAFTRKYDCAVSPTVALLKNLIG